MAQVTLMDFLQAGLPALPAHAPPNPGPNTTNLRYGFKDIQSIGTWDAFNLNNLLQRYQHLFNQVRLDRVPISTSPVSALGSEDVIRDKIAEHAFPRVRKALRAAFQHLHAANQLNGRTSLSFGGGSYAQVINGYRPDTAYYDPAQTFGASLNRAPGDIKPSFKWNMGMASSPANSVRNEFRQALSQVNYYMKQHTARYGFLLTNAELVVFQRLDANGNLQLAASIPYNSGGAPGYPQMTVIFALFCLGMMAAEDGNGPNGWSM
ncbi:hypothetical protein FQN54_005951 [Arachnomyces sp. PD_36]|nr:hypothetical protein FQN54_005951 [Arachnomyces sp. PD_36]